MQGRAVCLLGFALCAALLAGCGQSPEDELTGVWVVQERFGQPMPEGVTETRTFGADGTLTIERSDMDASHTVRWSISGRWRLRISPGEASDAPPNDYTYRIDSGTLTIAGEQGETVLTRAP